MAGAAIILPPQHSFMSSRRVPLANNTNAVNSPYRSAALKRSRAAATEGKDPENIQSPPKKKQLLETSNAPRRPQQVAPDDKEGRVFVDRGESATPTAFSRRLAAVRDAKQREVKATQRTEKTEKTLAADVETVKAWRRHYRRVFPGFVFYFDSLPHDASVKASRQVAHLGAREEKFFSKAVTHIVTTRPIPAASTDAETSGNATSTSKSAAQSQSLQRTINPSLLEKPADLQSVTVGRNGRQALEAASQRKRDAQWQEAETRRHQSSNADILLKGREMGMKIWAVEKFQRMMDTMFEVDTDELNEGTATRKPATTHHADARPEPGLLHELLRNEKNNVSDRPQWSSIIPFVGTYIYVHDVNEKTKPVMMREYTKMARKEDGDWPQFRSVSLPRCPFVEDDNGSKKQSGADKKAAAAEEVQRVEQQPRTRAASAALEAARVKADVEHTEKPAMRESVSVTNRMGKPPLPPSRTTFDPPPATKIVASNDLNSMPPQLGSARPQFPRLLRPGKEPMASGVQPSNVTSAIRSQMISSTAATAPTIKAGTTREMHQLQRRAVERRSGLSQSSTTASYMNNVRAAINHEREPATRRATRQSATRTLGRIHEDMTMSEDEEEQNETVVTRRRKEAVKKDPKPGYCENCRDRYDDFSEHVESKRHKKFANDGNNWTELDSFLKKLVRR